MKLSIHTIFVLMFIMLACNEAKPPDERHAYLEVTLKNLTGEEIDQTEVAFGTNICSSGILGTGASKTYLDWRKSVGANAVVRWRDATHTKRESRVSLTNVYDPAIDGTLIFSIAQTNATVSFQPKKQRR